MGKTQFGMQLAVDVQIPHQFGGIGGKALYIDTEGSLTVERLSQMCSAVVEHLQKIARVRSPSYRTNLKLKERKGRVCVHVAGAAGSTLWWLSRLRFDRGSTVL